MGLLESLNPDLVIRYVHDLVSMKCRPVKGLSRADQALCLYGLLEMMCPGGKSDPESKIVDATRQITHIAVIHHRFWYLERIADLYFELMNVLEPEHILEMTRYLESQRAMNAIVSPELHKGLLDLLLLTLEPNSEFWQSIAAEKFSAVYLVRYDKWISVINVARTHVESLVDLIDDLTLTAEIKIRWERLGEINTYACIAFSHIISCLMTFTTEYYHAFISQIAMPLELEPIVVLSYFGELANPNIRTQHALRSTISMLCRLNLQLLLQDRGSDLLCAITLERMIDPVVAADGFTYERSAISDWFAMGKRTSPKTNAEMPNLDLLPNFELKHRLESTDDSLNSFLEFFVFEVLFPSSPRKTSSLLPEDLIQDLIMLVVGSIPVDEFDSKVASSVLPSSAGRSGVLHCVCLMRTFILGACRHCARTSQDGKNESFV